MYENITTAKEKGIEAKREIVDRVDKQRVLVSMVLVLMVVTSGMGPFAQLSPAQPASANHGEDLEYVYHSDGKYVNKTYAKNGTQAWSINPSGTSAYQIEFGPNDNIHIRTDNKIVEVTPQGNEINSISTEYNVFLKMDRNGNYYSRSSSNAKKFAKINSSGNVLWNFTADNNIQNFDFDKNGNVYLATKGKNIRAISSDGTKTLWNKTGYSHTPNDPRVDYHGNIVFSSGSDLHKISLSDGSNQWSKQLPDGIDGIDTNTSGHIAVAAEGSADKIDAYYFNKSGGEIWNASLPWTPGHADIGYHGNIYFQNGLTDDVVRKDVSDGSQIWRHTGRSSSVEVEAGDTFRNQPTNDVELELDITDYQEPNSTREYRVYYIKNGERTNVTKNATVTSSNSTVITVDSKNDTLESGTVNTTVNVTAEYDGLSDTVEVTVSEVDMNYIAILPPAYWTTSIIVDPTMQWLFVAIVIGAVAGQMSRNKWAGMGTIQTVILIGWAIDLVDDGILMAGIAFLIFAGLITMQGSSQAEPIE